MLELDNVAEIHAVPKKSFTLFFFKTIRQRMDTLKERTGNNS